MRSFGLALMMAAALGWGWGWGGWGGRTERVPRAGGSAGRPAGAPAVPSGLAASLDGVNVALDWSDAANAESYWVYRNFGGDAEVIAVVYSSQYTDDQTVPGSPHYYQVAAVNGEGTVSELSAEVDEWPVEVKQFRSPFYATMQWGDYPDATLAQARIDTLAQFDAVLLAGHKFEQGGAGEPGYDDITARIRTKAASGTAGPAHDVVVLTYMFANALRLDASDQTETHTSGTFGPYPYARTDVLPSIWDWCEANDGWMKSTTGAVINNTVFPARNYNYANLDLADQLAAIYVAAFDASDYDGEYTGFLVDFANTDLQSWSAPLASVDLDQDGIAYNSDYAEETAIYRAFYVRLVQAMRREFGERGMANRLIVLNGNGAQNLDTLSEYVDGYMEERFNDGTNGYPGWQTGVDKRAAWEAVLSDYADPLRFPHSATRPYPFIYHVYADSATAAMSAAPAVATNGWIHANNPGKHATCALTSDNCWTVGCNGEKWMSNDWYRLPDPGVVSGYTLLDCTSPADADTLRVVAANYTMRMVTRPQSHTKGVWPYLVIASDGDTIARGGNWPRATPAPPAATPEVTATNGTDDILEDYGTFVLTGTGFGTKSPAAPMKWDQFEVGTEGTSLQSVQSEWVPNWSTSVIISTTASHSGTRSVACKTYAGTATANYYSLPTSQSEVFISYWHKYENYVVGSGDGGTLKLARINSYETSGSHYNGNGDTTMGPVHHNANPDYSNAGYIAYSSPGTNEVNLGYFADGQHINGAWFRVDMYKKLSSPGGAANGIVTGTVIAENSVSTVGTSTAVNRQSGETWLLDSVLMGTEAATQTGSFEMYEDDWYIDNTRARVEIGNAATLAASTHREIQIPSAWSATEITFLCNRGTMPGGTAYIFVVNSDGVASAGYPIYFE